MVRSIDDVRGVADNVDTPRRVQFIGGAAGPVATGHLVKRSS